MENKVWVIMHEEDPLCVCFSEADTEEMYMDLVMEVRYNNFCYNWLEDNLSLDICLNYEHTCSCGCYWIACEIPSV